MAEVEARLKSQPKVYSGSYTEGPYQTYIWDFAKRSSLALK